MTKKEIIEFLLILLILIIAVIVVYKATPTNIKAINQETDRCFQDMQKNELVCD